MPTITDAEIRQALMQSGHLLPTNEDAVAFVEQTYAAEIASTSVPSFQRLLDQIHGKSTKKASIHQKPFISSAMSGLARAARNGKELPPEIIKKMEADRDAMENRD
ncbi:hypothetical protein [Prosthecobacter sp.]|uniref:hypothetical protein n=1 Tax=Prosthecobacter sp. TaxID=1965333 RepID=UPI001DBFFDBE|nr:hypothetical protein [Prosthecobacter sp.]MCB1276841.1 hypothetical protein [Prosthecobacter sp.]